MSDVIPSAAVQSVFEKYAYRMENQWGYLCKLENSDGMDPTQVSTRDVQYTRRHFDAAQACMTAIFLQYQQNHARVLSLASLILAVIMISS